MERFTTIGDDGSSMEWFTRNGKNLQGKQFVYVAGDKETLNRYISEQSEFNIVERILEKANCAVRVSSGLTEEDIRGLRLVVVVVTSELFESPQTIQTVKTAQQLCVPILPLMMESGLENSFNALFNDLQCLYPFSQDSTQEPFDKKLQDFFNTVLVDDTLEREVKKDFDGYIFLSYRKKDRLYAQQLIRLIHSFDFCRDIAIWYDEALIPGENFNNAIEQALASSDIFLLMVTPSILEEGNYVHTTEYPAALSNNKLILPVEMVATDAEALKKYDGLTGCIKGTDAEQLGRILAEYIGRMPKKKHRDEAHHTYLMGIAYLYGIDVETDVMRAMELFAEAIDKGSPHAAGKLSELYKTGQFVLKDINKFLYFLGKKVELFGSCADDVNAFSEKIRARLQYECELRRNNRFNDAEKQLVHLVDDCEKLEKRFISDNEEPRFIGWVREIKSRAYNHLALCRKNLGYPASEIETLNKKSAEVLEQSMKTSSSMPIEEAIIMASNRICQILENAQNNPMTPITVFDEADRLIESISARLMREKPSEHRLAQWKRNLPNVWHGKGNASQNPDEKLRYYRMAEEGILGLIKEFPNEPTMKYDLALTYEKEFELYLHYNIETAFAFAKLSIECLVEYYKATSTDFARNILANIFKIILCRDSALLKKYGNIFCNCINMVLEPFVRGLDEDLVYICVDVLDDAATLMYNLRQDEYCLFLFEHAYNLCHKTLSEDTQFNEQFIQKLCGMIPTMACLNMNNGEIDNSLILLKNDLYWIEQYFDMFVSEETAAFAYRHSVFFNRAVEIIIDRLIQMNIPQAVEECRILKIKMELEVCRGVTAFGDADKLSKCLDIIDEQFEKLPQKTDSAMKLVAAKTIYYRMRMYKLYNTAEGNEIAMKDAQMAIDIYERVFSENPSENCAMDYFLCGQYVYSNIMDLFLPIAKLNHYIRHIIQPAAYLYINFSDCEEYEKALNYAIEEAADLIGQSYRMVDYFCDNIRNGDTNSWNMLIKSLELVQSLLDVPNLPTGLKGLHQYIQNAIYELSVEGYPNSDSE